MKLSTKIAYNTIVQIASKTAATVMGLFAIGIISRHLGTTGFGAYTTITTFLAFFGTIADLGLTLVTVQMISRPEADEEKTLNNLFTLRIFSALAIIGSAPLAVWLFPYDNDIKDGVALAAASFVFIALNQVLVGLFQKRLRMDKVSIAEVAGRALLLAGIILAATLEWGLNGYLIATVAASGFNYILLFKFSKKFSNIRLAYDAGLWKEIFRRSWPLSITIVLNLIYLRTDILFLSLWKPQAEVGLYGAAYKVIDVTVTIPFIFSGIILPIITARWHQGLKQEFESIIQKSFDILAIMAIPMVVGTFMLSDRIMTLVAGSEFTQSGDALKILIFGAGAIFAGNTAAHAIIAIDKQKKIMSAYFFTALTSLAGYAIFIPRYSYIGAAWITVYSEVAIAAASIWLIRRYTGFLPKYGTAAKSLAAASAMAAIIRLTQSMPLLLTVTGAFISYFLFLYLFRGISKKDIEDLLRLS